MILPNKIPNKKSLSAMGKPHPKMQFTPAEDAKLTTIVNTFGDKNWETVSRMMKNRNPRQCMERWKKYLSPTINRSPWTREEDELLYEKYSQLGAKWVKISKFFDNRTDAALKNRWNVLMRRNKSTQNKKEEMNSLVKNETEKIKEDVKNDENKVSGFNGNDQPILDLQLDGCDIILEPEFQFLF